MNEYTPTVAFAEREYVTGRIRRAGVTAPEGRAEHARMIAEVKAQALEEAGAERDAALAAIAAVRDVLDLLSNYADESSGAAYGTLSASFVKAHVETALAALDGAPEPEWEWGVKVVSINTPGDRSWLGLVYGRGDEATARRATSEANGNEVQVVRRRKAGPWEPVEGEKP